MAATQQLGAHVRQMLITRYGSMAAASDRLGIGYERIKKAIQRNRFSMQDLELLFPGKSVEELKAQFLFNFARRSETSALPPAGFGLYSATIEAGFRTFQRGVREIDFSSFVNDLYDQIGQTLPAQSMVLFCHRTSQPIEWNSEQVAAMQQLAHALDQGAIIIYVMETDLVASFRHREVTEDELDLQFDQYLGRLDSWRDSDEGFIALVRVRHCPFCVPFQKPALFTSVADSEGEPNRHHALTTYNVPEASDGDGDLGTAVLPQRNEVAHAMRDYLMDLVRKLRRENIGPEEFHFTASGKRNEREDRNTMVDKLDFISKVRNA